MSHSHARRLAPTATAGWLLFGVAAFVLLPWYAAADSASGIAQALRHGRPWLWSAALGFALAASGWWTQARPLQGALLIFGALVGLAGVLGGSFAIAGQPGIGWGGACTLLALTMLLATGIARRGAFRGDVFVAGAVVLCAALMLLFVLLPVSRALAGAFIDDAGAWSWRAFAGRIANESTWGLACVAGGVRCGVAWNTLFIALATATGTTVLGAMLALLAERGTRRLARWLKLLALLPLVTPPFVLGLGLILLFGRAGLFNQMLEAAFGVEPSRWFYGAFGLWLAQLFAFTPIAFMILRGAVAGISPSLEEAALTLRADRRRAFLSVTLPLMMPGLANAFLVGFIESIADFGNPIVVGGSFSVLSTDVFFAIVGAQYDRGQAAALALILCAFALAVFVIQRRLLGHAGYATVSGKGDSGRPLPLPRRYRRAFAGIVLPWLAFTVIVYGFAFAGGFVQSWGRDYTPTFRHFRTAFDLQSGACGLVWAGSAWNSLFTTLKLAAIAAPLGAGFGLLIAWLLARTRFKGQSAFEFGALLAFAVPGTVLGVSYVLSFNVPPFELTGSALIIVLCFVFRNLPVGVRAGAAALAQIDPSLDEASTLLGAGTATTLRRIVLPLLKPALVAALVYGFVRSITTVSAVVFLVTAENELATTYIVGRVSNGDYGVALAYCSVLIVLMSLAIALIHWAVGERRLGRRELTFE